VWCVGIKCINYQARVGSLSCVFYLTFENQFCGRELLKFIGIVPAAFMSRLQFYLIIKGGVFILIGIDAGARL
jgi:hypothetical protein